MTPQIFRWPQVLVFWAVYVWAFAPEFRIVRTAAKANAASKRSQDALSLQVIVLGMWLGLFAAFPLAFIPRFAFAASARMPALWLGTAVLATGSLLRRHCWRMLGSYFTGNVQTVAGQTVIDSASCSPASSIGMA